MSNYSQASRELSPRRAPTQDDEGFELRVRFASMLKAMQSFTRAKTGWLNRCWQMKRMISAKLGAMILQGRLKERAWLAMRSFRSVTLVDMAASVELLQYPARALLR